MHDMYIIMYVRQIVLYTCTYIMYIVIPALIAAVAAAGGRNAGTS
jgi:hypothetical protein